ncbi:hypothetical protein Kisp02_13310 [Kineosporia sp. NBRC 101731]|nr:hypothetical protein Kisp02_13310 [Kineosporia sp. NBRC 101731]
MLEGRDGQPRDYTEIAEALPENSSAPADDLRQLWRRIAFSIAIHNTDDHLRNHGFLRHSSGWKLSPAFDINPNPDLAGQRVTSIGGASTPADEVSALLLYADSFGLTKAQARVVLREVAEATEDRQSVARRNGISTAEIARFGTAFDQAISAVSPI